tara:strand:- start:33764 stop:34351 length:588 start_codon:yes stop_codon:yes gene_type:complete
LEIIIHRINTIGELKNVKPKFGIEIDIRSDGSQLILNHEPLQSGENFSNFLDEYSHGTLILNVKESGLEDEILRQIRMRPYIKNYFLLDVELPYLLNAVQIGERNVAVRFSELESIETVENFVGILDWVWIDTISNLPISKSNKSILDKFKKCLVCPERWGRPEDIPIYVEKMKAYNFQINAVMTSLKCSHLWEL